jgi:hypothetical protein
VSFQGVFDCSATNFSRNVNFFQSRFEDAASFSDSAFGGRAQFGLVKFDGLSSFESTTFSDEAVFNLARFGDVAYFYGARFMDKAFFGLTKFEDTASFQSASFEDDLILKGAQISTMILDKASYGKDTRVVLNDTNFARLKAPWNEIEDHVVYDPGAYLALINNYHGLGWATDEDNCYYSYRKLDQNHKDLSWSKIIDYLAWLSCGYGVKPSYAVAWSLLTIIIFAMIFWIGDGIRRSSKPLQGPAETDPVPERATFRNALFFSTMIFLSQGPIDFLPVGRHRYAVIIEGIIGWLMLALFLVTLGKVMIR